MNSRTLRNVVVLVVVGVFGLALLWTYIVDTNSAATYSYSQLLRDAKQVTSIEQDGTKLTVVLNNDANNPRISAVASTAIDVYQQVCDAAGAPDISSCPIEYTAVAPDEAGSFLSTILISLLPVLLIGTFIYFMTRSAQAKQ